MLKLRFLTDDPRWVDLAARYWQFDLGEQKFSIPVRELSQEFGIRSHVVSRTLAEYCVAYNDDAPCPRCGNPAWVFRTRNEFLDFFRRYVRGSFDPIPTVVCLNCTKKDLEEKQTLEAQRQKDENEIKKELLKKLRGNVARVKLEDLSLEQAVFLDAYGRIGLTENFSLLLSLQEIRELKHKLAPSKDGEIYIAQTLFRSGLIRIHPENSTQVIKEVNSDDTFSFYTEFANFYFPVNVQIPDDPASLFKKIEQAFITRTWPDSWKGQVLSLWRKIALWECLEYLKFVLDEHSLDHKPGEKTINMFEDLLTRYATAQIFNFIWRAGRDAAAFYMRGGVTKAHAANTVVGTIQRLAERAEAEDWEVKKYQRNYQCAQSVVSQVLFNVALKIGDEGFGELPKDF